MSEELEKKKKQLQEMRLRTLYNMVENVTIRLEAGHVYHKRVLYLTRDEAFEFGLRDIPRVLTTLGITEHTLVIRFPRSMGGLLWFDRSERTKLSESCTKSFDEALAHDAESLPRATVCEIFKTVLLEQLRDRLTGEPPETVASEAAITVEDELRNFDSAYPDICKDGHVTRRALLLMLSSCYAKWRGFLQRHKQYSQEAVVLMERQAAAERKLQSFMRNVLLPIAVRTNALFVVDGLDGACSLGTTLQQCIPIWVSNCRLFRLVAPRLLLTLSRPVPGQARETCSVAPARATRPSRVTADDPPNTCSPLNTPAARVIELSLSRAVLAILSSKDVSAAAFSVAKEEGAESFDVQLRKQTTSWQENVESRELESKSHQVSTTEEERTEKVAWKHTVAGRGERGIFKVATHYIITENFAAIRHFSKGAVRHP